jgi:hypothetical protein
MDKEQQIFVDPDGRKWIPIEDWEHDYYDGHFQDIPTVGGKYTKGAADRWTRRLIPAGTEIISVSAFTVADEASAFVKKHSGLPEYTSDIKEVEHFAEKDGNEEWIILKREEAPKGFGKNFRIATPQVFMDGGAV